VIFLISDFDKYKITLAKYFAIRSNLRNIGWLNEKNINDVRDL